MMMEQIVPKRQHINFSRRGITQKKAYNNVKETEHTTKTKSGFEPETPIFEAFKT